MQSQPAHREVHVAQAQTHKVDAALVDGALGRAGWARETGEGRGRDLKVWKHHVHAEVSLRIL